MEFDPSTVISDIGRLDALKKRLHLVRFVTGSVSVPASSYGVNTTEEILQDLRDISFDENVCFGLCRTDHPVYQNKWINMGGTVLFDFRTSQRFGTNPTQSPNPQIYAHWSFYVENAKLKFLYRANGRGSVAQTIEYRIWTGAFS